MNIEESGMTVWVAGGRDYTDKARVFEVLDVYRQTLNISVIVEGSAPGVDSLAEEWAKSRQIPYIGVPAKWDKHGKAAGPIRNEQIAKNVKPDYLFAFPGGKGTANARILAERYGIPVLVILK